MDRITTEENSRRLFYHDRFPADPNETTKSLPSSTSRSHDGLYRNSQRIYQDEESKNPGLRPPKDGVPEPYKRREVEHADGFNPERDSIKKELWTLMEDSYHGNPRLAVEGLDKMAEKLKAELQDLGIYKAEVCLEAATIYSRGGIIDKALIWLNKAKNSSQRLKEKDDYIFLRKLYVCLADTLLKKNNHGETEIYLSKAENLFVKYPTKNNDSKEVRRTLSWTKALRAHIYASKDQHKEAEDLYRESIDLKATLPDMLGLEILGIDYLIDFFITHGRLEETKYWFERAEEVRKRQKLEGYYTEARLKRNKARIALIKGDREESKKLYGEAFVILDRELTPGNYLRDQYEKEYREKFGVGFGEESIDDSFQTNTGGG